MNKIRQILRLHHLGIGKLKIADNTGVARNTIKKYIKEFSESGLNYAEINVLCDKDLEDLFVKHDTTKVNPKLETLFSLLTSAHFRI